MISNYILPITVSFRHNFSELLGRQVYWLIVSISRLIELTALYRLAIGCGV
jgi:hypothetical protein